MSKRKTLARYNLIIKKLRRYPTDFEDIARYLEEESRLQGYDFTISKRTFQRDVKDILFLYNIDIQYDFSKQVYYIDFENKNDIEQRILESFDTFNALQISPQLSNYIYFDRRRPKRTEYLQDLLKAIKERYEVKFMHQKFDQENTELRQVRPLALQEFKNRWYLIGEDIKKKVNRTFAFDRISDILVTHTKFRYPKNFDVKQYFKGYYGIVREDGGKPVEIELSFNAFQGKYIKSLPLHPSQKIISDTPDELRIKLNIVITYDFIIELLSLGKRVKVIKPKSLISYLQEEYQESLDQYQS